MRVAVIGAGAMGQNHVRVLKASGADIAGVADLDVARAKAVAGRFDLRAYASVEEVLKDRDVGAVTVATTTGTHAEVALAAILAGKHLLVEKPLATSVKEAQAIVDAARHAGLVLATGHVERFNPVVEWAARKASDSSVGNVVGLNATRVGPMPPRATPEGVIRDLAVHDIDVVRYVTRREVKRVTAVARTTGVRSDHATLLLDLGDGVAASLVASWLTPMKVRRVSVTCTGGVLELDYIQQVAEVSHGHLDEPDAANMFDSRWEYEIRRYPMRRAEPLQIELTDFLSAATSKRPPRCTGEDGLRSVEVAEAAVASSQRGCTIEVAV